MSVTTFVSQAAMAPGTSFLICRVSVCRGDELALEFPDNSRLDGRVVERLAAGLTLVVEGRRLSLRPWTRADQSIPDYRGEASRWAVAGP